MEEYKPSEVAPLLAKEDIKLVNCKSLGKMFWRYIPLSRLEEMLNKNQLIFVYPELWKDPYEKLYLKTDFSALNNYNRPDKIYCLCGRGNGNEEASWKVYSDGSEPLICVRFNLKKLLPRIRSFVKNNCNIYYSKVSYVLSEKEINGIHKNISPLYNDYFPSSFSEEDYVRLMSLKRQSFAYEGEYRIFIVPQRNYKMKEKRGLVRIPIDYDIFERFTIGPMEPIRKEDSKKLMSQIKLEQYKIQNERIESFIKAYFGRRIPIPSICHSSLYSDVSPIDKI